jgi:hypothetical protein
MIPSAYSPQRPKAKPKDIHLPPVPGPGYWRLWRDLLGPYDSEHTPCRTLKQALRALTVKQAADHSPQEQASQYRNPTPKSRVIRHPAHVRHPTMQRHNAMTTQMQCNATTTTSASACCKCMCQVKLQRETRTRRCRQRAAFGELCVERDLARQTPQVSVERTRNHTEPCHRSKLRQTHACTNAHPAAVPPASSGQCSTSVSGCHSHSYSYGQLPFSLHAACTPPACLQPDDGLGTLGDAV